MATAVCGAAPLDACFGDRAELTVAHTMPYVVASIGSASGYFLIDHGSNFSTVDTAAFEGTAPRPNAGTDDRFDGFRFLGEWGTVQLRPASHAHVDDLPFKQAGIIGTDLLSTAAYTIDYVDGALYRASAERLCTDAQLRDAGFVAVSTAGYFASDASVLKEMPYRLPAVPIRLGGVAGFGILDPGFGDVGNPHSLVINAAYVRELRADLFRRGLDVLVLRESTLSACVAGASAAVLMLKLPPGQRFEVAAMDGSTAISAVDATLKVRTDPVPGCRSIEDADVPLALVGASFLVDAGRVLFDPYSQRVWLPRGK